MGSKMINTVADHDTGNIHRLYNWLELQQMYLDTIPAYVYYIRHIPTGKYYYGSRYKHIKKGVLPEDDLWIKYFSSSNEVKKLLTETGRGSFETSILYKDMDLDAVFWKEQDLIKQNITDPNCLNKHFFDSDKTDKVFSFAGRKHSAETIKIKQGQIPWNTGLTKHDDPRLAQLSQSLLGEHNPRYGKRYTSEEREEMSRLTTGIPKTEKTKQLMRKPKTTEHAANISKAALQRPRFPCDVCGKLITKANINNHRNSHNV